jgi:hypothetical protein
VTCTTNSLAPLIRGDTRKIDITITDEFGVPVNIQGHKIYFTLKTDKTLADSLATLQVSSVIAADADALAGKTVLVLSSTNMATVPPGKYFYDIQWVTDDATPEVTTIALGIVSVEYDITVDVV